MRIFLFMMLTALLAISGCKPKGDCDPNLACTMEFRYITIYVHDTLGAPYPLDSVFTVKFGSEENIYPMEQWFEDGYYTVLSDNEMELVSYQGDSFTFKGYREGVLKVSEPFLIRNDCCHINLVEGNTAVMVTD